MHGDSFAVLFSHVGLAVLYQVLFRPLPERCDRQYCAILQWV